MDGTDLKRIVLPLFLLLAAQQLYGAGFVEEKVWGDVMVRRGVAESWVPVNTGDLLDLSSTLRTGPQSSVALGFETAGRAKTITLPPEVIVNCSDLRELSQEELLLQLTMEKVRSTPARGKTNGLHIPNATVVHGDPGTAAGSLAENDAATGRLVLNGSRVLFDHGYFPTCALRTIAAMRQYPSLAATFDARWLSAEALEKANLRREALEAFTGLAGSGGLTADQQGRVREKIVLLKGATGRD